MVQSRSDIWSYDSTGDPNVGKRFRHIIVAATAVPKIDSKQDKMLNSVVIS